MTPAPASLAAQVEAEKGLPEEIVKAIEDVLAWQRRLSRVAGSPGGFRDSFDAARAVLAVAIFARVTATESAREAAVAERDEALREHADTMWQRRRADERADAALARAERAEKALEWQPIATAPKDNEDSILVCDARVVGGFHQVVWWSEGPRAAGYNWYTSDGPNFHKDAFTHWMPLPVEPAALAHPATAEEQKTDASQAPAP